MQKSSVIIASIGWILCCAGGCVGGGQNQPIKSSSVFNLMDQGVILDGEKLKVIGVLRGQGGSFFVTDRTDAGRAIELIGVEPKKYDSCVGALVRVVGTADYDLKSKVMTLTNIASVYFYADSEPFGPSFNCLDKSEVDFG